MAVDRYTKLVLTVIAVCLAWIAFGGPSVVTPVAAQNDQRVIVSGWVDEKGFVHTLPAFPTRSGFPVWQMNK